MKFYALASNKDGQTQVLKLNEKLRHRAEIEAKGLSREQGLTFNAVYKVKGTEKAPSTMQKRFASNEPTKSAKRRSRR